MAFLARSWYVPYWASVLGFGSKCVVPDTGIPDVRLIFSCVTRKIYPWHAMTLQWHVLKEFKNVSSLNVSKCLRKFQTVIQAIFTLSWRRCLSYRNQFINLLCKLMNWFIYDRHLHHERVKGALIQIWKPLCICLRSHKNNTLKISHS